MNIFIVSILSLMSICGCNSTENKNKTIIHANNDSSMRTSKFYEDIDLFTFSGINELPSDKLNYPYIEITKPSINKFIVTYHVKKGIIFAYEYVKKDDVWSTNYSVNEGLDSTFFYKFIFNNKIVSLRYRGNPYGADYELMSLDIMSKDFKEIGYSFNDGLKVKPTADVNKLLKNKIIRSGYTDYLINNGILTVIRKYTDLNTNKLVIDEKECYNIGKHSYFWWGYFCYDPPIECK